MNTVIQEAIKVIEGRLLALNKTPQTQVVVGAIGGFNYCKAMLEEKLEEENQRILLERFKLQLVENKVVTEELLAEMKSKTYHNGDEIKIGDQPLYGMIIYEEEDKSRHLQMIILNLNQIDLYEIDDKHNIKDTRLPIIKLKMK